MHQKSPEIALITWLEQVHTFWTQLRMQRRNCGGRNSVLKQGETRNNKIGYNVSFKEGKTGITEEG
jgi:hypothetical protein